MSEDDPFEELDEPDEQADPLEGLEDPPGTETGSEPPPGRLPDDPFDRRGHSRTDPTDRADRTAGDPSPTGAGSETGATGARGRTEATGTEPGAAIDGGPDGDPFASFSDVGSDEDPFEAFESVDVGAADPDAVWEELAAGESPDGERTYAEVSKHRFCERCEHFTGPPEVACTNEGTAIVEFLDMETVRLVDCPVVAEREDLERP